MYEEMANAKAELARMSLSKPRTAINAAARRPNDALTKSNEPPDVLYLAANSVMAPAYSQ
jgi:hypothetical protein